MKTKKMAVTITGDDANVLKQLGEKSGLLPSEVIGNLLKGVMARGWARCEATGDKKFYCPELQQKNERGEVLQGQELFEILGQLALMEIHEVINLAETELLRNLPAQGKEC